MVRPFQSTRPGVQRSRGSARRDRDRRAPREGHAERSELVDLHRRPPGQGAGHHPRRPRVHAPRELGAPAKSVMWSFNRAYWRHLASWDETFQKDYAAALPGGVSDGTNPEFWGSQLTAFLDSLDRLDAWSELPDEIHVLELGVGDGEQALVWLDTFDAALSGARPRLPRPRALPHGRLLPARARACRRARRGLRGAGRGHRARLPQPDARPRAPAAEGALRAHLQPLRQPPDRRDHARRRRRLRAARPGEHHARRGRGAVGEARDPRRGDRRQHPGHHPQRAGLAAGPGQGRALLGRRLGRRSTSRRSTSRSRRRRRCASRRPRRPTSTRCCTTCPTGRACTARPSRWRASRRR